MLTRVRCWITLASPCRVPGWTTSVSISSNPASWNRTASRRPSVGSPPRRRMASLISSLVRVNAAHSGEHTQAGMSTSSTTSVPPGFVQADIWSRRRSGRRRWERRKPRVDDVVPLALGRSQVGGVADQVAHVRDPETSGLVGGELDDDGVEVDAVDPRGGRHLGDDAGDVTAAAAEIENPRGVRDPGSSEQRCGCSGPERPTTRAADHGPARPPSMT